jgi:hypothetical protein
MDCTSLIHSTHRYYCLVPMPIIESPMEIITPPKRYAPVGHCIYCGVYTKSLSKEHIIPFGLAEDSLVLPKASCPTCSDITRKHETIVLRTMWWTMRTRLGSPSRHEVPKDFNLHKGVVEEFQLPWITKARHIETIKVAPQEFPFAIITLKFPQPPSVFLRREPNDDDKVELWARYSEVSCTRFRRHRVRCFMEQEVRHGEKAVYAGVQA